MVKLDLRGGFYPSLKKSGSGRKRHSGEVSFVNDISFAGHIMRNGKRIIEFKKELGSASVETNTEPGQAEAAKEFIRLYSDVVSNSSEAGVITYMAMMYRARNAIVKGRTAATRFVLKGQDRFYDPFEIYPEQYSPEVVRAIVARHGSNVLWIANEEYHVFPDKVPPRFTDLLSNVDLYKPEVCLSSVLAEMGEDVNEDEAIEEVDVEEVIDSYESIDESYVDTESIGVRQEKMFGDVVIIVKGAKLVRAEVVGRDYDFENDVVSLKLREVIGDRGMKSDTVFIVDETKCFSSPEEAVHDLLMEFKE
jgi:hypothetical protein